jgi:hypothetical protein
VWNRTSDRRIRYHTVPTRPVRCIALHQGLTHVPSFPKRFDLKAQLARLRTATSEHDHLSESLASSFQDGEVDEDEFVRQYLEVRRVYHRRALQVQKMAEDKVEWRV